MWKKILFGASRRFANDASRIVGNEMRKKMKQQPDHKAKSRSKQKISWDQLRADHLNMYKKRLLIEKSSLNHIHEIYQFLLEKSSFEVNPNSFVSELFLDRIERYLSSVRSIKRGVETENRSLNSNIVVGESLGALNNDYTIKFKSMEMIKINEKFLKMISIVEDMAESLKDPLTKSKFDVLSNDYLSLYHGFDNEINEKYKELTEMNIIRIWDHGETKIIDYND